MRRIAYLDGLRGLAAMQVLGEHYSSAFTGISWHWLRFFTASDCAVYLFFLMSGFVLTPSFEKAPHDVALNIRKRIIRLGLPASAALLLALILYIGAPDVAAQSAQVSHSTFMIEQTSHLQEMTLWSYLEDALGISIFAGFQETSLLFPFGQALPTVYTSLDPPIWSLHVELWGSALVLLLVWASTRSKAIYALVIVSAAAFIGINSLILFLIGHLCARMIRMKISVDHGAKVVTQMIAAALVIGGVALCSDGSFPGMWFLQSIFNHGVMLSPRVGTWPTEVGAVMIFVGVLYSPLLHHCLNMALPRWLGRLSFPVYLLHWPIMMVVGASTFLWAQSLAPEVAAGAAFIVGLLVTFTAAAFFERWCDKPVVMLSQSLGKTASQQAN